MIGKELLNVPLVFLSVLLPSFLEGRQDGVHDIHPSSLGKVSINLAIVITAVSRGSGRLKKKIVWKISAQLSHLMDVYLVSKDLNSKHGKDQSPKNQEQ